MRGGDEQMVLYGDRPVSQHEAAAEPWPAPRGRGRTAHDDERRRVGGSVEAAVSRGDDITTRLTCTSGVKEAVPRPTIGSAVSHDSPDADVELVTDDEGSIVLWEADRWPSGGWILRPRKAYHEHVHVGQRIERARRNNVADVREGSDATTPGGVPGAAAEDVGQHDDEILGVAQAFEDIEGKDSCACHTAVGPAVVRAGSGVAVGRVEEHDVAG